jgi:AIPR protein
MKDIIILSQLKSFSDNFGFEALNESKQFERFCFFSIINSYLNYSASSEDIEDIDIGEHKNIDGIAILIDGKLAKTVDEYLEIRDSKQRISISIYFFQAKTSAHFDDKEIANFLDTIIDFLGDKPAYTLTAETVNYHNIYKLMLERLNIIKEINLYAYYCTTGNWNKGNSCEITIEKKKKVIKEQKLFENVFIEAIDGSKLKDFYKKASNPISAEFEFRDKVSIRYVENVDEAYVGTLPFSEFKKLIIDPNNGNLRSLFYDNVRDFLGIENDVNSKIKQTLEDKKFAEFSLLNNGITIIASENKGRADRFLIHNYQIVNGCQTSNVLYECRGVSGIDKALIPVKVIITQDEDLRDKIILSTNSQSKIEEEELLALTKFQKRLEEYYLSTGVGLHYERRNNQYANRPEVKKKAIVDIREQIKSFVGMFFDEPHEAAGFFGRIYRERKSDIFADDHLFEPYFIAGMIQYKFKEFLNAQEIERKYNKARYHCFMLFRMLEEPEKFKKDFLSVQKRKNYFNTLLNVLKDHEKCRKTFKKTFEILDKLEINIQESKQIYNKSTTNKLLDIYKETYK